MAWPIVKVPSGGIPVTEVTNGFGTPVEIASNGFGTAVTVVADGGIPVIGSGGLGPASFLLMEDASKVLQEDGSSKIII